MLKKLEIITSLIAGTIILILGFVYQTPLLDLALRLLIVMIIFWVIGLFVKRYVMKTVFDNGKDEEGATPAENDTINDSAAKNDEEGNEAEQPDEEV